MRYIYPERYQGCIQYPTHMCCTQAVRYRAGGGEVPSVWTHTFPENKLKYTGITTTMNKLTLYVQKVKQVTYVRYDGTAYYTAYKGSS